MKKPFNVRIAQDRKRQAEAYGRKIGAFYEGYRAFKREIGEDKGPYDANTDAHLHWLAGWHYAQLEASEGGKP